MKCFKLRKFGNDCLQKSLVPQPQRLAPALLTAPLRQPPQVMGHQPPLALALAAAQAAAVPQALALALAALPLVASPAAGCFNEGNCRPAAIKQLLEA